ncbi:MAG: hypothetical protein QOH23_1696 [Gaiellaceae bacterium]|nr:hypothetical protein [Gaiellaceae bacterium]
MFFLRGSKFGRLGPLGMAFTGYQLWQRLSPSQRAALRSRAQGLVGGLGSRKAPSQASSNPSNPVETRWPTPAPVSPSGAATPVPSEEVTPSDLTSPGTIADPELEEKRAQQALDRELESRASDETKFEELRREQEAERQDRATAITEPPAPRDEPAP